MRCTFTQPCRQCIGGCCSSARSFCPSNSLHPADSLAPPRRCTHLTMDVLLAREKVEDLKRSGVRATAQALLDGPTASFWRERTFTVCRCRSSAHC